MHVWPSGRLRTVSVRMTKHFFVNFDVFEWLYLKGVVTIFRAYVHVVLTNLCSIFSIFKAFFFGLVTIYLDPT